MPVDKVREILRVAQEPVSPLKRPSARRRIATWAISFRMTTRSPRRTRPPCSCSRSSSATCSKTLTPREEKVLSLRFGLEDGHPRTLEEVGKEFNVTRERIRQIEAKALRKLRHPSRSKKLKDFLD